MSLPDLVYEPLVRAALLEDLGFAGDITTDAVIPADATARAAFVARAAGVVAGIELAACAFRLVDKRVAFERQVEDGARVSSGAVIATVEGTARAVLSAERVALNFLGHLSGVATATARIVASLGANPHTRVVCTRKTTPGLRALEKYAVRCGGGRNHRFGLGDAMLIKDNHIAIAGGLTPALARARAAAGHLVKIEVEVETLAQLDEALAGGADAVLLDNMDLPTLGEAVARARGRAITEASGRITEDTAPAIAATGVDLISAGAITHSAPVFDIGLDM